MTLSNKQQAFVDQYLIDFNGSQAAIRAGYSPKSARSTASELLTNPNILAEIKARVDELTMSAEEVLIGLTEQARGDIGTFFKTIEEWTFYPLPSYEILGEKEVVDDSDTENPKTRTSYWCRHVVLDMDKLIDPKYSRLVQEFTDSPKNGLGIKLYSRQSALMSLAKLRGMLIEKQEITGKDGGPLTIRVEYADDNPHPAEAA